VTEVRPSLSCQRVREQVSLLLDDELSQLERRMLTAHLRRCPECAAYSDDVTRFTDQLRYAPLEPLERQIVVHRPRRRPAVRLQAAVAAAFAFAALGLGSQLASGPGAPELSAAGTVTRFPTQAELQREMAILAYLPHRGSRAVLPR
jgi:predicted anti-sigma-YlaC factor YlaD